MTDLRAYCYQCHHAWMAHDDGTDDGDYCRACECDGYVTCEVEPLTDPDPRDAVLISALGRLDELSHLAGTKASDFMDESDYERGRYQQGMCDAFAYSAAEIRKQVGI